MSRPTTELSIDFSKLENTRQLDGKTVAACPACRADGHDKAGDHLVLWPDGRFGCVKFADDTEHRKRIWQQRLSHRRGLNW